MVNLKYCCLAAIEVFVIRSLLRGCFILGNVYHWPRCCCSHRLILSKTLHRTFKLTMVFLYSLPVGLFLVLLISAGFPQCDLQNEGDQLRTRSLWQPLAI